MTRLVATHEPLRSGRSGSSPWGLFVRGYGDTKVEYHSISDWLEAVEELGANGKPLASADDPTTRLIGITDWSHWHCFPADLLTEQADQWVDCGYDLRTAKGRRALAAGGPPPSSPA